MGSLSFCTVPWATQTQRTTSSLPILQSSPPPPSSSSSCFSFYRSIPEALRVSSSVPSPGRLRPRPVLIVRAMGKDTQTGPLVEEKLGVRIERNPPESRLAELGVRSWPKWGCPPSKFPWTYSGTETCYLLKGKVKVYAEGSTEYVEIGGGDLVVFPNGMSCTWEVFEAVDKHYSFS